MTAQAWQQVLERIEAEARTLTPRQVLLTLISAPLFALGWLVCKTLRAGWLAFTWSWTAALVGWRIAGGMRGMPGRPDKQVPL